MDPRCLPHFKKLRLTRGEVRLHRKIRARKVECVLVILAHRKRALLRSIRSCTNQRTGALCHAGYVTWRCVEFDEEGLALKLLALRSGLVNETVSSLCHC